MTVARNLTLHDLLAYMTSCAILVACLSNIWNSFPNSSLPLIYGSIVGLFVLSGPVIVGPVGFVIGGRRGFRVASWIGLAIATAALLFCLTL